MMTVGAGQSVNGHVVHMRKFYGSSFLAFKNFKIIDYYKFGLSDKIHRKSQNQQEKEF
jgi:hypothetical protein